MIVYIERLTLLNLFVQIAPTLLTWRPRCTYIIEAHSMTFRFAQLMFRLMGVRIERLTFQITDMRDEYGASAHLQLMYFDTHKIMENAFRSMHTNDNRLYTFIKKSILQFHLTKARGVARAHYLIQVSRIHARKIAVPSDVHVVQFLEQRFGWDCIEEYARAHNVDIHPLWSFHNIWLRNSFFRYLRETLSYVVWHVQYRKRPNIALQLPPSRHDARIAIEYYAQFNLDKTETCHSDFFFYQQSKIDGRNLVALFHLSIDPLDAAKEDMLCKHHIDAYVLRPGATDRKKFPPCMPRFYRARMDPEMRQMLRSFTGFDRKTLKCLLTQYVQQRSYWKDVFHSTRSKIFVTWQRFDGAHCGIGSAIRDVGGIIAIYQRSLELTPMQECSVNIDVGFGYSRFAAELEAKSGSKIPYYVITGYLGDHRFSSVKKIAQGYRERLLKNSAQHIVSFTDENTVEDARWQIGHAHTQEDYAFLLEKVLTNAWFGLVLKPKAPTTLRKRLGPVLSLLEKAIDTGRCLIIEGGPMHGSYPPALAALTGDIAIHSHVTAATAAFEAALNNVPTLVMDRLGFPQSPLYQLGVGTVVFKDWHSLWEGCQDYWAHNNTPKDLGNWGPLIDQLDPFRDGRAAERMGEYLHWLIQGLKDGKNRETAMAEAAERYSTTWGSDTVLSIDGMQCSTWAK